MRTTATFAAAVVVLLGSAAPAGAAPAKLRSCHTRADFNLLISSARNMFCSTARRDLRRHHGSTARRFTTPGGFTCMRVSGGERAVQWRYAKGRKAYRFKFAE